MIRKEKVGDLEVIEPVEMAESVREIVNQVLLQNEQILAINKQLLDRLTTTAIYVKNDND